MRNDSNKRCKENKKTLFMFNNCLLKCHRLWDDVGKFGRAGQFTDNNTIGRMRFEYWVTTTTDTHSECVMLAVPWQQWWSERAAILRFKYFACLVFSWHCSRIETSFISRRNRDLTCPHWTTVCGNVYQTFLAHRPLWASENNYGFLHPSSLKYILYAWYNPKLKIYIS
jgi:hypothetical protein